MVIGDSSLELLSALYMFTMERIELNTPNDLPIFHSSQVVLSLLLVICDIENHHVILESLVFILLGGSSTLLGKVCAMTEPCVTREPLLSINSSASVATNLL